MRIQYSRTCTLLEFPSQKFLMPRKVVIVLIILPIMGILYCACKSTMPATASVTPAPRQETTNWNVDFVHRNGHLFHTRKSWIDSKNCCNFIWPHSAYSCQTEHIRLGQVQRSARQRLTIHTHHKQTQFPFLPQVHYFLAFAINDSTNLLDLHGKSDHYMQAAKLSYKLSSRNSRNKLFLNFISYKL